MRTNIELKKINRNNVYRTVVARKRISKQEISYALNLSIPTVSQSLNELEQMGLVRENGTFESTGGRKAKVICSNSGARVAFGIDITKNHVNVVLVDLETNVLKSLRKRIPFEASESYYEMLREILGDMEKEFHLTKEQVLGVGISIPAIVSEDRKSIVYAPLLNSELNLYEDLKDYISYPYFLLNDAKAGSFAELYCGNRNKNMIYLMLSNSVGGGILINGGLYYGRNNKEAEFGHMTLVSNGRPCYCGKKGCLDSYCSALVLKNESGEHLEDFFAKLAQGDEKCKSIWQRYEEYLAIAINNIWTVFDCDIVLGGYVGWYIGPYMENLQKRVEERSTFSTNGSYLRATVLNKEASAMGAALVYINEFINCV